MAADESGPTPRTPSGPERRRPSGLERALVALLLPGALRQVVVGDLLERFAARCERDGPFRARLWLWGQIARLRPIGLRRALRAGSYHTRRPGEATGMGMSTGMTAELRQALRALRTRFGFSVTVVMTVVLAVGATTSVFSVVNGVLLRPLDFPVPDRLVLAWQTRPGWLESPNAQLRAFANRFPLSVPTFNDWHEARTGFESSGIYTGDQWVHQTQEGADILRGLRVTSGVFEALGVEPALGRSFAPDDDRIGADPVLVLSHSAWRDRFGADPAVIGRGASLDGMPHTVIGVMPEGFTVPGAGGAAWASLSEEEKLSERGSQSYTVLGRLREGASEESLLADLEAIQTRLSEAYPVDQVDMRANVQGLLDSMVGGVRSTLLFLLAAVGLVLLIACVNIANMLSVGGLARRRELAVKAALGASRTRLARGLLTECAVLAGLGGAGGLLLAVTTLPVLVDILPSSVPRTDAIGVDARVFAFGILVTALTTLLVGVLPALQAAAAEPKSMMDQTARGLAGGRLGDRIRSVLVVTEVALAFALLVGAGLLATSFSRLWNADRGFMTEGLVAMTVVPHPVDFPERAQQLRFRDELHDRLAALPGVEVAYANQVPLAGSSSTTTYHVDRPDGTQEETSVMISVVGETYLDVMGIAVLEGRGFDRSDDGDAPLVGIVNRTMARRYWPGESALGKVVRSDVDAPPTTIVGVVADVKHQGLHEEPDAKLYVPAASNHRSTNHWVLRTRGDAAAVMDLARREVSAISSSTPVRDIQLLEERIEASVAVPRFRTYFVVGLAGMATVLALLGVYGVVTFAVSQRTRELAVRMAIGAHPRDVVAGTLSRGMRLAGAGVGVGLGLAWIGRRAVEEFLYQVEPTEPVVYAAVAVTVAGVCALASYLPARRASRVDPVTVLNSE